MRFSTAFSFVALACAAFTSAAPQPAVHREVEARVVEKSNSPTSIASILAVATVELQSPIAQLCKSHNGVLSLNFC